MHTPMELREMAEWIIDQYFTSSLSNRKRFFSWFDSFEYYKFLKNSYLHNFYTQIDINRFENEMFESYNYFFYDYFTKKFLVNVYELNLKDVINLCSEIIERTNENKWIDEVQKEINVEDYII